MTRDIVGLEALLRDKLPDRILLNVGRNAVQVLSCDGKAVVEHYALREIDLEALIAED